MVSSEFLLLGGGVVGLSIAWELAQRGGDVVVVEREGVQGGASWAGGGMLPPASFDTALHPVERLRGLANELHPVWAEQLRESTGIDTGYRRCGAIHVARTAGEAASLAGAGPMYDEEGIEWHRLEPDACRELEPELQPDPPLRMAYFAPDEAQLRNPRHLNALATACKQRGVRVIRDTVRQIDVSDGGTVATGDRASYSGKTVCITMGAWTGPLLREAGVQNGILPVRGQMVLYHSDRILLRRIVIEGTRYVIPRDDGHLLVGSTEEEVGFDTSTTEEAIDDLIALGESLVPALKSLRPQRTWAGLRPASFDGLPYMGHLPGYDHTYVAAGHFRHGLSLSPAIAVVMADAMTATSPRIDLAPFAFHRAAATRSS